MKKLLLLFILLPFLSFAQKDDTTFHLDIHGCYVYAMRGLVNGWAGLTPIAATKKTKTVYFEKRFYTVGFPEEMDGYSIRFVDFDINKETLLEEQHSKKALVMYMSELNLTADTCDLWMIPVTLQKKGGEITKEYSDAGCHVYFHFNKDAGKLGYLKTVCEKGKKD